jgi:methyl-accepting chemotaxis protein
MDQVTQQNAALVEQTAAASHSMGDQAQELQKLMGFFKLDERAGVPSATVAASPAKPRPELRAIAGAGSRTLVAKPVVKPRARPTPIATKAVATAPAAASDEWEEF